jgi:uncharacterized protein (TIGR01319 family)
MSQPVLCIDFGSTFTKVVAVDVSVPRIMATARAFTTITTDINDGLDAAIAKISKQTNIYDWPLRYACSSAAGGLKMVAIGLVPELTSEAAKRAALSGGAKVLKTYGFELNQQECAEIERLAPDIILFTGGIDGGNQKVVFHNQKMLCQIKHRCPLIYAGNKTIADQVRVGLKACGWEVYVVDNVMPAINELNIDQARDTIRDVFLNHIIHAKGLSQIEKTIENIMMPTPSAVLKAAELLCEGTTRVKGIGELMIVDVGGATTDVHSVAKGEPKTSNVIIKGLQEPYIKRSVEGDLGARYSLPTLVDAVGKEVVASVMGTSIATVQQIVEDLMCHPESFANEAGLLKTFDDVAAEIAVKESTTRHAGFLQVHYTPFGTVYEQTGKDLTGVLHVIGTGGPLVHHHNIHSALKASQHDNRNPLSLKPHASRFYLDRDYIISTMGLLSTHYPHEALTLLKRHLVEV